MSNYGINNMYFYKYFKINKYSLDAIKNKYFYCSRPSQLNDLFDCRIPIDYCNSSDGELESWIACNGGGQFKNLFKSDFPYNNVQELRTGFLDGSFEKYFYTKFNQKEIERYHIFSLTTSYDNPVIWGTYNDNKGICLEYEAIEYKEEKPIDIFSSSKYGLHVKNLPKTKFYSYSQLDNAMYLNLFKINYISNELQKFNPITDNYMIYTSYSDLVEYPSITQNLISKNINWSYENEYRAVFPIDDNNFDNKVYYSDEVLKSITFGYRVSTRQKKYFLKLISFEKLINKVKFYEIKPNFSKKTIERYEIPVKELERYL